MLPHVGFSVKYAKYNAKSALRLLGGDIAMYVE